MKTERQTGYPHLQFPIPENLSLLRVRSFEHLTAGFMKYIVFAIVLMLYAGILGLNQAPSVSPLEMAVKDLEKLREHWVVFERSWLANDKNCYAHFNRFRQVYRSFEFLLPLMHSEEEIQSINNSKFWVWQDSVFQRQYPATGSLQFLEKILLGGPEKSEDATLHLARTGRFIAGLPLKLTESKVSGAELLYAVVLDQYRQYFLTLSAYDRLDTGTIMVEYKAALNNHHRYLEVLEESQPGIRLDKQLKESERLIRKLRETEFDELERLSLLRKNLQPLLGGLSKKALLVSKNRIPEWAQALQWNGVSPFSANWLNPLHFTTTKDTIAYDLKVATGKLLFFDPILSSNNKRTCASCHKPQKAFTDGRITSQGFDFSAKLPRNAPSLVNTVFNREFGHDGRFPDLEAQIRSVIYNHQEFRSTLPEITQKLATSGEYRQLFARCFPGAEAPIDSNRVLEVLAVYTASLVSFDSPLDRYMQGVRRDIEATVVEGYNLFMGKAMCGSCHFAPLFSGLKPPLYAHQEYHSHGIDQNFQITPGSGAGPGTRRNLPLQNTQSSKFAAISALHAPRRLQLLTGIYRVPSCGQNAAGTCGHFPSGQHPPGGGRI